MHQPRILIIGAGLSGLMAALRLAEKKVPVSLFSILPASRSDASCRRGGLNAALNPDENDSPENHFSETIVAGDYLANQEPVHHLCRQAPAMVEFCHQIGVCFDRTEGDFLKFYRSEGSPYSRTLFAGEATGQQLLLALDAQLRRYEAEGFVERLEGWEFLSALLDGKGRAKGVVAINRRTSEIRAFEGGAVIFCTGGLGALFGRSTQSLFSNGSAASLLYQQGAVVANGEFISIEPATLAGADKFVSLTSAVLKEGGRFWTFRDGKRWYFLEEFYPSLRFNLPSLVACRAIHKVVHEMKLGIDQSPVVYLDLSHQPRGDLQKRLGCLIDLAKKLTGIDLTENPLPVTPAVSYFLGGLWVDDRHMTTLPGVFAAGECAYQYHGANPLEANLFLSGLVGGRKAADEALAYCLGLETGASQLLSLIKDTEVAREEALLRAVRDQAGQENPYLLHQELGECFSENVFIVRRNSGLKKACEKIEEIKERFGKVGLTDRGRFLNETLFFTRALGNMLEIARLIVYGALMRDESRGCHFKPEFPRRDDENFLKTTKASWTPEGPKIHYEDVHLKYLKPYGKSFSKDKASGLAG